MFCSVFKVLDVKMWPWHKAKCFVQQLFDVGYMAAAHKPQHINPRTAARPYASIKKVENIFTANVSHVLGTGGGSAASVSSHALWSE